MVSFQLSENWDMGFKNNITCGDTLKYSRLKLVGTLASFHFFSNAFPTLIDLMISLKEGQHEPTSTFVVIF
jgi:hypothetical protein